MRSARRPRWTIASPPLSPSATAGACLAPELPRIADIAQKVARGLYALRYGPAAPTSDFRAIGIFGPGNDIPQRLVVAMHYWPGARRRRWTVVQEGIFGFVFTRGWLADDPPLLCLLDLADTLLVAVARPQPVGRSAARRLRAKPW